MKTNSLMGLRQWNSWVKQHDCVRRDTASELCYSGIKKEGNAGQKLSENGAGDGDRTRNQRLGKPLLYH
jgi:hypothetical protein